LNIDIYGQVWAGTWNNGLHRIRYNGTGDYQVENIDVPGRQAYSISSSRVTFVYTDGKTPEVLVGTDKGLDQLLLDTTGFVREVRHFTGNERKGQDLSSSYVWPILRENKHTIWAGTLGSGGINKIIFKEDGTYNVQQYTHSNGMPVYDIEGMLMDNRGKLWLGGKNLMTFDPVTEKFDAFGADDGFQLSSFKNGSAHKGKTRLYFGGINGVIYFNPDSIQESASKLPLVLTGLAVDNKFVRVNQAVTNKAILQNAISYTKSISLNHLENNFAIKFAAFYFPNPHRCRYRYKLIGYNKDWVYVNASLRTAYFSNLDYGKYHFVVEASSGSNKWICSGAKLEINILPPWWKTTTAYISYFIFGVLVILGIDYYKKRMYKLKQELELHVMEEKKNEELHQLRLQFFTNISHEFRTPLTLILGPAEKLLNEDVPPVRQRNFLEMINKNTKRLLSLINELMDFRQVESQNIKLNAFNGDLNEFVKTLSCEFEEVATRKNIWYTVKAGAPVENVWFDHSLLEKILINLISNAFKYTENGGSIEVELLSDVSQFKPEFTAEYNIRPDKIAGRYVWIKIADSGIGISAASISNIFDRYYRVRESDQDKHLGSGVGLAIVRNLALQHHFEIRVYSERNKGTQFLIGLPCGKEIYTIEELASQDDYQREPNSIAAYIKDSAFAMEERGDHSGNTGSHLQKPRILVAEDNNDMRAFIYESLGHDYDVILAVNGEEALAKTREFLPELIISDLVMPVKNGIEFCTAVKQDISINHIPFILTTAMSSAETQLESAEYGADIYFPKPFSMKLLQLTIRNIMETRGRIKERYSKDIYAETRELVHNNNEKQFIDSLISIIEANIDNTDLEIDWITRQVGISRTSLYAKVKSITGQTLGEFILMLRLKQAAKILATEEVTASETMYKVGIQSQSYFIKAFKKQFGKTPFAFQQEHRKGCLNRDSGM
jgi:signal transduction histidine kinase/DNA-binding response OmpR family regulator